MLSLALALVLLPCPTVQDPAPPPEKQPEVRLLWPDGARGDDEADRPKLHVYRVTAGDDDVARPAIVVCPGGGYGHLAMAAVAPAARLTKDVAAGALFPAAVRARPIRRVTV